MGPRARPAARTNRLESRTTLLPPVAEQSSCSICRRRSQSMVAVSPYAFCRTCLSSLGRFVRSGHASVQSIWRTAPTFRPGKGLQNLVAEEMAALGRASTGTEEPTEGPFAYSVEEVFDMFKARLEVVVKPADAETHLDLAVAYRETGLSNDALTEAAIALEHGASLSSKGEQIAVSIVLDPKGLRTSLEEALAILRSVLYPD